MQYSTLLGIITIVYCCCIGAFFCWRITLAKTMGDRLVLLLCEIVLVFLSVFALWTVTTP